MNVEVQKTTPPRLIILALLWGVTWALPFVYYSRLPQPEVQAENLYILIIIPLNISITLLFIACNKALKRIEINVVDILVLVYILYGITSLAINEKQNIDEAIARLLTWCFYFNVRMLSALVKKERLNFFVNIIFTVLGIFLCIEGLLQLYGVIPSHNINFKVTGPFLNPGPYAIFLVYLIPIGIGGYYSTVYKKYTRPLSALLIGLIVVLLPILDSRISILLSLCILLYFADVLNFIPHRLKSKAAIITIGILIAIGLFFYMFKYKQGSSNGRLVIWNISWNGALNKPIFGHGLNSFKNYYGKYQIDYYAKEKNNNASFWADKVIYAYNDYLQIFFELGIIGIAVIGALLFLLLRKLNIKEFKHKFSEGNTFELSIAISLITVLVSGLVSYPLENQSHLLFLVILIALINNTFPPQLKFSVPVALKIASVLFGTFSLIYLSYWGYNRLKGYEETHLAEELYNGDHLDESSYQYNLAYKNLDDYPDLLTEYGKVLNRQNNYAKSLAMLDLANQKTTDEFCLIGIGDDYAAMKNYNMAEKYYMQAIHYIPNRMYPKYVLFEFYKKNGNINEASNYAKQILTMPVKSQSGAVSEMQNKAKIYLGNN